MTRVPMPYVILLGLLCSATTFGSVQASRAMSTPAKAPACAPNTYTATVTRVIDGDTLVLLAHVGLGVHREVTVRLTGIDTPELKLDQLPSGRLAKAFAESWVERHENAVTLLDKGLGKYGRTLGIICPATGGECLADALRKAGHEK